jgi:hypothetical protein
MFINEKCDLCLILFIYFKIKYHKNIFQLKTKEYILIINNFERRKKKDFFLNLLNIFIYEYILIISIFVVVVVVFSFVFFNK